MRLNKYIAQCGFSSRRKADEYIVKGAVKVNNEVIKELGYQVDAEKDKVTIDNNPINIQTEFFTYIIFHKPKGCICSASDDRKRKTIFDYIDFPNVRLFSVGRLDYNTEGLLLLTNDGDLANKLMHPSYEIEKRYIVKINSQIKESELATIRKGVTLEDGYKTLPAKVRVLQKLKDATKLEVTIKEGKYRQIHRMFDAVKKEVIFLKRVDYGPLHLGGVPRGGYRELNQFEIDSIKSYVGE